HVSVHSDYIKRVDYLEAVEKAHASRNHGELLVDHLKGTIKKASFNGDDLITGYSGLHLESSITESFLLDVSTSSPYHNIIGGKEYIIGPIPTGNGIRTAKVNNSELIGTGSVKEFEIRVWGYARENIGTRRFPNWQFVLDSNGNPIKAWVQKTNNRGRTTVFINMSDDKALNEIAFARYNLELNDFQPPQRIGQSSNEWHGMSSEGTKISMYLDPPYLFGVLPSSLPNVNTNYASAFPKLNH
ncbi:hypothetical protein SY27_05080, partial [Flavobacterium sp. 316]|uniref:hypothetical protein n=1 Tax=Flavobacterium sp. 316 TaxID=1603293 RepID=UPI0005E56522